jgi:hypothetical protein
MIPLFLVLSSSSPSTWQTRTGWTDDRSKNGDYCEARLDAKEKEETKELAN